MADIALEKLIDKSYNSVYKLVILTAKRALELAEGQPRLVNMDASSKPSIIALEEIAAGRLQCRKTKPEK
jgi:DNA-directed RNA polymerase omega subunit